MKTLRKWLINEKGFRHLLGFFAIGYSVLFICSMIHILNFFIEAHTIAKYVVFFIVSMFTALEIEYRQKNIHKKEISKSDIVLSVSGMILAIPINQLFNSWFIFILSIILSAIMIIFVIKQLKNK
jgi:uncharacterized membrane protein